MMPYLEVYMRSKFAESQDEAGAALIATSIARTLIVLCRTSFRLGDFISGQ